MRMPIYYTTSAPCRPNNAIVIGGVNTAAKRRIQRKALHSCRKMDIKSTPMPLTTSVTTPPISLIEYNCLTKEGWYAEKQQWCCEHKKLGCSQ
jgi:hypothetical protein